MRSAFVPILCLAALMIAGCLNTRAVTPREYLDEQTAATITVVSDPWIFTRGQEQVNSEQRDFLHVYAIDVNRMGNHRQYLAVLQSLPPAELSTSTTTPLLALKSSYETMQVKATDQDARDLGIAQPIAEAYSLGASWWYFPVDKQTLAKIANSRDLSAEMIVDDERLSYVLWRDGREELSELTAVLP